MSFPEDVRALSARRPAFVVVGLLALAHALVWPLFDFWLRANDVVVPFVDATLRGHDVATPIRFGDFGAYAGAVENWQAGEPIYERNDDGGYHGSFLYPPLALLLFYPLLELFDFRTAAIVWELTSLALLWVGLQLVVRELGYRLRWWHRGVLLWALLGFQPLIFSLKWGQTAGFMVGLLSLAFVALSRQERGGDPGDGEPTDGFFADSILAGRVSGALTGVVGFVKFAYAPVGAHLLADRERLVGALTTGGLLVAFSLAIFGVEAHLTYLEVLAWGAASDPPRSPTVWLPPYFKPLGWIRGTVPLLGVSASLLVRVTISALVAFVALTARDRDREIFALGLAVFPIVAPTTYGYYLTALLPAAFVAIHGEFVRDGRPVVPLLGLWLANCQSYGLRLLAVTLPEKVPALAAPDWVYFLAQPGLWGVLLVAGVAFVRVAEDVRPEEVYRRARRTAGRPVDDR